MKRFFLGLSLLLFPRSQALAQEIPLDEFHNKVKGLYYDYKKEGMKGFQCQVQSGLFDQWCSAGNAKSDLINDLMTDFDKAIVRPNYQVDYDLKEVRIASQWDILFQRENQKKRAKDLPKPESQGKEQDEERNKRWEADRKLMETFEKIVGMEIKTWALLALPMGNDPSANQVTLVKSLRTSEGYELQTHQGRDQGVFYFTPDLQMTRLVVRLRGEKPVTLNTDYEKTSKGLRIRSCDWTYGKVTYKAKATYRTVDDYYVPDRIETTFTDGRSKGVSVFDTLKFDHYNVDW